MQEPQSDLERKDSSKILEDDPSILRSIPQELLDRSNVTCWVFPTSKSTSSFLSQSTVSYRSKSSSEANSGCCNRSDT